MLLSYDELYRILGNLKTKADASLDAVKQLIICNLNDIHQMLAYAERTKNYDFQRDVIDAINDCYEFMYKLGFVPGSNRRYLTEKLQDCVAACNSF